MDIEKYLSPTTGRDWQTIEEGTVRFALVGLGWWTRDFVVPALESASLSAATVAVSGSPAKAKKLKEGTASIEAALSYEEFEDGAALDAYDAVYVATPNATHLEYVAAAAAHGKDVLCEKPMEASVERAERMVAACEKADVTLMIAYRMQTEPVVRLARTAIERGLIGTPVLVRGQNAQPLLEIIDDPDQWRLDPDLSGYGASVTDLGIYPLNTARYLLDADPVAVGATMRSPDAAFDDAPDEYAAFSIEFDDGTYAACTASQNAYDTTSLEVVGTDGKLTLDPAFHMETTLRVACEGGEFEITVNDADQMREEFEYFAHQLLADEPVYADGEHGLIDMRAIEAIHEAAKRETRVRL